MPPTTAQGETYRTVCVRTCDGYFFPISYSTVPGKFPEDEKVCQRLCPASEAVLYSYRNPGEDVSQAVSSGGRTYSELPNAFSYRKAFNPACSCKLTSQTWADALKQLDDQTVERGDIVGHRGAGAAALAADRCAGPAAASAGASEHAGAERHARAGRQRRHHDARRQSRGRAGQTPGAHGRTDVSCRRTERSFDLQKSNASLFAAAAPSFSSERSGSGSGVPGSRKRLTIG